MKGAVFGKMAKLSVLEVVCIALCMNVILWQETSSSSLGPYSAIVTQETTTNDGSVCDGITCPRGKSCGRDRAGRPHCFCDIICTADYDPVCGSDGKTHGNACELRRKACDTETNITMVHKGECEEETSSSSLGPYSATVTQRATKSGGYDGCAQITCPPGKYCTVKNESGPVCGCYEICYLIYAPVCGSDGNTYANDCVLRVEACKTNKNITIIHEGVCNDSCTGFECPNYGYCESDADNKPKCLCHLGCPKNYDPVCGSDNRTYSNECVLKAESCGTNTSITVAYRGRCGSACNDTTCPPGKSCTRDDAGQSKWCTCNTMCPDVYDPVCGSDGKTYGNDCELSVKACETETNITVAHKGECVGATTASDSSIQPGHPTKKPKCNGNKQKGC